MPQMLCVKNEGFLECISFSRGDVVRAHANDVAMGLEDPGGELFEYPDSGVGNAFAVAQIVRLLEMAGVGLQTRGLSYSIIAEQKLKYARDHGLRIIGMVVSAEGDGMGSIGRSIGRMYGAVYDKDKKLIDIDQAVL